MNPQAAMHLNAQRLAVPPTSSPPNSSNPNTSPQPAGVPQLPGNPLSSFMRPPGLALPGMPNIPPQILAQLAARPAGPGVLGGANGPLGTAGGALGIPGLNLNQLTAHLATQQATLQAQAALAAEGRKELSKSEDEAEKSDFETHPISPSGQNPKNEDQKIEEIESEEEKSDDGVLNESI